jgi:hypothetical protein
MGVGLGRGDSLDETHYRLDVKERSFCLPRGILCRCLRMSLKAVGLLRLGQPWFGYVIWVVDLVVLFCD